MNFIIGELYKSEGYMGIIFVIFGVITILLTILRLPFYWDSRRVRRMRGVFGDTITMVMYLGIGILLSTIGMLELVGEISF